jgi:hypothetical protein
LADLHIQLGRSADGREKRRRSAGILLDLGWLTVAERPAIAVRLDPPVPAGFWTNI